MPIFFRKNIGWLSLALLAALPALRWLFLAPLSLRFSDFGSAATSLGQIFGLTGLAMFSLNLILASRLKIFDEIFYGLNRMYNFHRANGTIAFSLLLFHPLFLVFNYLRFSVREAALFLLPFAGVSAKTYGSIALGIMAVLIIMTFYVKIKYHYWKISHKFMTLAFVFALLHVFFIGSDVSRDPILRTYLLSLGFIGLAAGSYRAWLSGFFNKDFTYQVVNLNQLNLDVVEIGLEPVGRAMKYRAGQFVFLRLKGVAVSRESHPFSMSSSPAEKNLKFLIKNLGDYTAELRSLRVGDLALVEGPFGKFSFDKLTAKKQIWLAGGIGIAPFLGLAADLAGRDYEVDLYYSVKDKPEAVLLDQLMNLSSANHNFKVRPWYSNEQGRISGEKISELSHGLKDKEIFICGPLIFMTSLREQLMKLGVSGAKIHWEKFDLV